MTGKLVLLRHGQSTWNQDNLFTGWTDVDLTEQGRNEARNAGIALRDAGYEFDIAFTSVLKRAIRTLWIVLDEMDMMWLPVDRNWVLNERHYGSLQGSNKAETVVKYGMQKVQSWRRGYEAEPPPLQADDPRHPRFDRRYSGIGVQHLPATESLATTLARVLPHWRNNIAPRLRNGEDVLVVAHGNSLRALVMELDHLDRDEILKLHIPTGIPLTYDLDANLKALDRRFLGDPEAVRAAQEAVAAQLQQGQQ